MRRFISPSTSISGCRQDAFSASMIGRLRSRISSQVRVLVGEELLDVGTGWVVVAAVGGDLGDAAGQQHDAVGAADLGVLGQEDRLVGEDVALVAEDVVELPQLVVEEARRAGDREDVRRPSGRRCSARCGRTAGRASACRTRSWPPAAARRPSGTRSRRRTAAGARARGPARRRRVRSVGRASFWLSSRTPSYSTQSDESPIGPSVGLVSAWIMIFRPPSSSTHLARSASAGSW